MAQIYPIKMFDYTIIAHKIRTVYSIYYCQSNEVMKLMYGYNLLKTCNTQIYVN